MGSREKEQRWSATNKPDNWRPGYPFSSREFTLGICKIEGELQKLGHQLSSTTVKNILDRHNILPAPVRFGSIGWRKLMSHYKDQLLASDFFTVETICLQTIYVLFFIELGSRRVHLACITTHPDGLWVAQQGRQLIWQLEETNGQFRCLIRDNDSKYSKYTDAFDTVFESQQIHIYLIFGVFVLTLERHNRPLS